MHSLSRCALRCWTMTSTPTCQAAFSTCRLSMSDSENSLFYQSVGWVSPDLREVRHEPWMQWRRDFKQRSGSRKVESVSRPSSSRGQGQKPARKTTKMVAKNVRPVKPLVTSMSGAITLAKSSSGSWRNIGRSLLPTLPDGLPPPPPKYSRRRAYRFVPIHTRNFSEPHPDAIPGHDNSLEEYYDDSSKQDLEMPYLDTDEYALLPKTKRKLSNVSGLPMEEWTRSGAEMLRPTRADDLEELDETEFDSRPDYILTDPSRFPRVGSISRLPTAAKITVEPSEEDDPNLPRRSGRLWRNSPIILATTIRKQRRS